MTEIIQKPIAPKPLVWTGERMTDGAGRQVALEHYHRYLYARHFCRDRTVLDIASGEGYGSALIAQVAAFVHGVDIDPASVQHASSAYAGLKLRFMVGDARKIPLPDASVDVVISFETIEHFDDHPLFLKEVGRVLRKDGLFIISSPDSDIYSGPGNAVNPFHVLEIDRPKFAELLKSTFSNIRICGQRAIVGSVVGSGEISERPAPMLTFERKGAQSFTAEQGVPSAVYLIGMASNGHLPAIPDSIFIDGVDVERAPEGQETGEPQELAVAADMLDRFMTVVGAVQSTMLAEREAVKVLREAHLAASHGASNVLQEELAKWIQHRIGQAAGKLSSAAGMLSEEMTATLRCDPSGQTDSAAATQRETAAAVGSETDAAPEIASAEVGQAQVAPAEAAPDINSEAYRVSQVQAVWGRSLPVEVREQWSLYPMSHPLVNMAVNRRAAGDPNLSPYTYLAQLLKGWGWRLPVESALSLCCGTGAVEQSLVRAGVISRCIGYDLATGALAKARETAAAESMSNLTYVVRDLENDGLDQTNVDLVLAHQGLHHISKLENVLDAVHTALRPGGLFHVHEFVGPDRFQWTDRQLDEMTAWIKSLPPRYRITKTGEEKRSQERATIAQMIASDPSEAVRASAIERLVYERFEVVEHRKIGGTLAMMALSNIGHNFDPSDPDAAAHLGRLIDREDELMASGEIESDFAVLIARKSA